MCLLIWTVFSGERCGPWASYFKQDYEFQKSEEAKFVKDLDKFEMILQAHEYEKQSERPGHLQEFFDSTDGE